MYFVIWTPCRFSLLVAVKVQNSCNMKLIITVLTIFISQGNLVFVQTDSWIYDPLSDDNIDIRSLIGLEIVSFKRT